MNLSHILIILALISYAVAASLYLHAFPKVSERLHIAKIGFVLFVLATVLLTGVVLTSFQTLYYTQTSGLILMMALSWLTIGAYYLFGMRMLPTFTAPFVMLLLLVQFFTAPRHSHIIASSKAPLAEIHIWSSILGEAFAICACAISVLFLMQQNALKRKQLARINSATPPIDKLEGILVKALWSGFAFISFGLVTGAIYTQFFVPELTGSIQGKIIWAFSVWGWYLIILLSRNIFNFPTRKIAIMSCLGFFLLSVALFGLYGLDV